MGGNTRSLFTCFKRWKLGRNIGITDVMHSQDHERGNQTAWHNLGARLAQAEERAALSEKDLCFQVGHDVNSSDTCAETTPVMVLLGAETSLYGCIARRSPVAVIAIGMREA